MGLGEGPGVGGQTWVGGGDGGHSLRRRLRRDGAVCIDPFSSNRPAKVGELGVAGGGYSHGVLLSQDWGLWKSYQHWEPHPGL